MAPHWLLYWGHTKVRTCVIDGPVSGDRGPSPSLSSCGPQTHRGILAVLGYLCPNIWASWTERAGKRTSKPSEDASRGESNHRCTAPPPYLSLLTLRNITPHLFTLSPEQHDVISPLSPMPLPLSHCQSLYWLCSFIGTCWCTSVNGGIHFGCQSQQGIGHQVQMCQYTDVPDALWWRK